MKVMLAGAQGQLGHDLVATAPHTIELDAHGRATLDITNAAQLAERIQAFKPQVFINAAAYNAVDQAQTDNEPAYRVNTTAVKNLASICRDSGVRLIHLSTDYVFEGSKNTPYQTDDQTHPLSVYGQSKLGGEQAIQNTDGLAANIVRVSWLYGEHGNNFVHTMLRLMQERDEISVVSDQIGGPTWTRTLAQALWQIAQDREMRGLWHWSDLGVASWYDFANAIYRNALDLGIIKKELTINPITTAQYPTLAARPTYSVLDSSQLRSALRTQGQHWNKNLQQMLERKLHV